MKPIRLPDGTLLDEHMQRRQIAAN